MLNDHRIEGDLTTLASETLREGKKHIGPPLIRVDVW